MKGKKIMGLTKTKLDIICLQVRLIGCGQKMISAMYVTGED